MSLGETRRALVLGVLLAGFASPARAETPSAVVVDAEQSDLSEVAQGLLEGDRLRIQGLQLDQLDATNLELERFEVFAPDAQVIVDGVKVGPPPRHAYFRGEATAVPGSMVVLTVPTDGPAHGMVKGPDAAWIISVPEDGPGGLVSRKVDLDSEFLDRSFRCGVDDLTAPDVQQEKGAASSRPTAEPAANAQYTARVIVDTDFEYYSKFNNQQAALTYMGDLFAFASATYEQEVNTSLLIGSSRLFTTNNDPYASTDCCPGGALAEVKAEWSSSPESRTIVHLLSGKSTGCGCAYVGVLCNDNRGYGVSLGLDVNFDPDNPQVLWDSVVVTHEIGHNFNSPHTHDYCGKGGNPDPVDLCVDSASICGTALGLPGPGSLTGGAPGQGNGTIMSYCHFQSGGFSNIGFTFGLGHPYGVAPDRVPDRMYDHVVAQARSHPGCIATSCEGWDCAYADFFDDPEDADILRQYRERLASTVTGGYLVDALYSGSENALGVLERNPALKRQAKVLIRANMDAVKDALEGRRAVISNSSEIAAFLNAYAEKAPAQQRALAELVVRLIESRRLALPGLRFE